MIKALNIRLYPTKEQEILMYKHIGSMRFVYNWALDKQIKYYKNTKEKLSTAELGKELTKLKNTDDFKWLYEVSNATLKESIRDLDKAYKNLFNGGGFPKFKSKKKSRLSFYSRYEKICFKNDFVNLEKIGKVKYKADYNIDLTNIKKFSNPRVNFNGRVWILSVGIEVQTQNIELNNLSIGIDLGIKKLAITNIDELDTKNINKSSKVKKLSKKLKKLQRKCSKKYLLNKKGGVTKRLRTLQNLKIRLKNFIIN